MTDAEISRRLALAIGWKEADFHHVGVNLVMLICASGWVRRFDYKNPTVIWPIAERFDCFPWKSEESWYAAIGYMRCEADTAAKAVALTVIKAQEQQK